MLIFVLLSSGVFIFMNKFMKMGLRVADAHHFVSHCLTQLNSCKLFSNLPPLHISALRVHTMFCGKFKKTLQTLPLDSTPRRRVLITSGGLETVCEMSTPFLRSPNEFLGENVMP